MPYILYCLVLGEATPFPVKINKTQSVAELKKAIKKDKKKDFNDVDANNLTLYKIEVDISDDTKYEAITRDISRPDYVFKPKVLLNVVRQLARVFPATGPPKDTIHILVERPQSKSIDP